MFLLSGIRFGSVRFDLFRFGPPRRNGTPPRQPFAGRTQRIRRRAAFVFRSAATTSARHRTFAPPPVGPPRRVRPPCRRHGLHSARCRRPFIRPLRRGIRPPHGSGPLRSSPVLSGPLRSSPVLSSPLRSSPVLSSPLRSSPVLSGPLRSPAARCARRPHSASCASLPRYGLRRPSSASSAPHDAHRIRRPAVPAGRPIRIPSFPRPPGFNRRAQPPRPLRPGLAFRPIRPLPYARFPSGIRPASLFRSGFRFPVSGPTPPRCPAP